MEIPKRKFLHSILVLVAGITFMSGIILTGFRGGIIKTGHKYAAAAFVVALLVHLFLNRRVLFAGLGKIPLSIILAIMLSVGVWMVSSGEKRQPRPAVVQPAVQQAAPALK